MSKKLHIKTFGCQMNVYDSQRMTDVLGPLGYETVDEPNDADMVILNTCHIREKATEKVFSDLGRLKKHKTKRAAQGKSTIIAVAGCVAQAAGKEITRRAPYVDMVFGPQTYHRLPEMVARATRAGGGVLDLEFPAEAKFDHLPAPRSEGETSAFISVQEGCDKFCTYCVVPYTRGAEFSRPVESILDDVKTLASEGVREINLLGQNVNAFHGTSAQGGTLGLGDLIREVATVNGIERIRYITSHPADMDDSLITAHGEVPQLMPFLHLPIQSGADPILRAMNRGHSAQEYRETIARLKEVQPNLALSSDFIIGFPGETDKDFENTMALIQEMKFIQAYSFKFSPRPGTPAVTMENQVEEKVKSERLTLLQDLLGQIQVEFNNACVGKTFPVLLDREGRDEGQLVGRSPYMQPVHVTAPTSLKGEIIDLKITDSFTNSLSGVQLNPDKTANLTVGASA
ncbi:MAG: tRNA (N6-isopentenyl adenosine(37)-C2)-methylthiotransferase MiaB [Rhodospirillales bacterium]|nr:tRNA (N6-isopentenyl adenosine(37)-C2)-methylthiotransferase MiaB [Rhodospirillales bacterium]